MADLPSDQGAHLHQGAPRALLARNLRRSERVFLVVPIRILGEGDGGQKFSEEGETLDVSRHGATISLSRLLPAGQDVTIERIGLHPKRAVARVLDEIHGQPNHSHAYGVEFLAQADDLWDITFPPAVESEKAVLRALLRCLSCRRLEVSYLDEFETELFLVQHNLPRLCSKCGGWTTWTQPYGPMFAASEIFQTRSPVPGSDAVLAHGRRDRRNHGRIRLETVACVRHPDLGHEIVLAGDLARGGLSFFSPANYAEGTQIEIAVPYSSRVPNIFVPARIISSRKTGEDHLNQYGISVIPPEPARP